MHFFTPCTWASLLPFHPLEAKFTTIPTTSNRLMKFAREILTMDLCHELLPLFEEHHNEMPFIRETELEPNFESYVSLERLGFLRLFTARADGGEILGHIFFMIAPSLQARRRTIANNDVLFIRKEHRGFGNKFIKWCVEELRNDGIDITYITTHTDLDFGPMLMRMNFEKLGHIYMRRF